MKSGNWRRAALLALAIGPVAAFAQAPNEAELERWLDRQTEIQHWQAQVSQTRHFKGLSQPLQARGRVWIAQPDRLRWELGEPPQTIAIRDGDTLTVHHPQLGETESFALAGDELSPAGQQAQALLAVGFPVSHDAFFAAYSLLSASEQGDHWQFLLKPRDAGTQRILDEVLLQVRADGWRLDATEFRFPDGSRMRNDFSSQRVGAAADEALFDGP